jgi:hypothetical protein
MSSNCIHLPSNQMASFFLYLNKTPLKNTQHKCMYTYMCIHAYTHFLNSLISCKASGWFYSFYIFKQCEQCCNKHGVQVYLLFLDVKSPSGVSLAVVLMIQMEVLFLVFWGSSLQFSTMVSQIYIPTSSVWEFLFPPSPHQY